MSEDFKARVYRSADVLLLPSYVDAIGTYTEACAFGVPVVTTRIHHGDDFVREGESGYLVDAPLFAYGEGYGSRWKSWPDFISTLEQMRASGKLDRVVEDVVDRLEMMISGDVDLAELRRGARRLHAERFSPEVRNAKIKEIYARALEQ